jgi:hypothetical protein
MRYATILRIPVYGRATGSDSPSSYTTSSPLLLQPLKNNSKEEKLDTYEYTALEAMIIFPDVLLIHWQR